MVANAAFNLNILDFFRVARRCPRPTWLRRSDRTSDLVVAQTDGLEDIVTEAVVRRLRREIAHQIREDRHNMRFAHYR